MSESFPRFEYWNTGTRWYWHLVAANGLVIVDGSEGYDSESNVKRAIANLFVVSHEAKGHEVQIDEPE